MKKLQMRSLILGFVLGSFFAGGAFAATNFANIERAEYSDFKVVYYGNEIKLSKPLVEIQEEGSEYMQLYAPVRDVAQYFNLGVDYNQKDKTIGLTLKGIVTKSNTSKESKDAEAIEVMKKTGNWDYMKPYLDTVSNDTIRKIVEIYNSKHINPAEHKNAEDYIKK